MNYAKFVELVTEMRSAQRQYFRTRSYADLDYSKIKEREVDQALREIQEDKNQLNLFGNSYITPDGYVQHFDPLI